MKRIVSDDLEDIARSSPIARTLPVLEIDGRRKFDSIEILTFLDTSYPTPPVFASDPNTAEAQYNFAHWSDGSFAFCWNHWRTSRDPQLGACLGHNRTPKRKMAGRTLESANRPIPRCGDWMPRPVPTLFDSLWEKL